MNCDKHTRYKQDVDANETYITYLKVALSQAEAQIALEVGLRDEFWNHARAAEARNEKLAEVLRDLMALIESGELVRATANDGRPDYTPRMVEFVMTLKKAAELLAALPTSGEPPAALNLGDVTGVGSVKLNRRSGKERRQLDKGRFDIIANCHYSRPNRRTLPDRRAGESPKEKP